MSENVLLLWADLPQEVWTEVPQNENISYMFDETTPVKACGDLAYHVNNTGKAITWRAVFFKTSYTPFCILFIIFSLEFSDDTLKEPEECRETCSQSKRRRMLQFNCQEMDHSFSSEQMSSAYFKSNVSANRLIVISCFVSESENLSWLMIVQNMSTFSDLKISWITSIMMLILETCSSKRIQHDLVSFVSVL